MELHFIFVNGRIQFETSTGLIRDVWTIEGVTIIFHKVFSHKREEFMLGHPMLRILRTVLILGVPCYAILGYEHTFIAKLLDAFLVALCRILPLF